MCIYNYVNTTWWDRLTHLVLDNQLGSFLLGKIHSLSLSAAINELGFEYVSFYL